MQKLKKKKKKKKKKRRKEEEEEDKEEEDPYPKTEESTPHLSFGLGLTSGPFLSGVPTKTRCASLFTSTPPSST